VIPGTFPGRSQRLRRSVRAHERLRCHGERLPSRRPRADAPGIAAAFAADVAITRRAIEPSRS